MKYKNKKQRNKIFTIIIVLLVSFFTFTQIGQNLLDDISKKLGVATRPSYADDYDLSIHIIDVGCADSILIESENFNCVIDGGTPNYSDDISTYVRRRGIEKLDAIFITHPDYDHYSGFTDLFNDVKIDKIYTSGATSNAVSYDDLVELANDLDIDFEIAETGGVFGNNGLTLTVVSQSQIFNYTNDMSIVMKLEYKDFSALFTGDVEADAYDAIFDSGEDIDCDLLKVSHHGSKNGTSKQLLEQVTPSFAAFSTSPAKYNFPDKEVVNLLEEYDVEYFRTDLQGTIMFCTNGFGDLLISTKEKNYERTYS